MEDRASAGRVGKAHRAAKSIDDLLHDAEAQAGAALLPCVRGIGLRKSLEDARSELDWNAGTAIAHRKTDDMFSVLDRHYHFAIRRRKFDRIRKQVGHDLGKPVRIGPRVTVGASILKPNAHAMAFRKPPIGLDCLLDQ